MIKIIGGQLKGRYIDTRKIDRNITRPTQAILRKSVFELLTDVENATILDLFAGSGIMGIEALSRKAKKVFFIDKHKENINILKDNLKKLSLLNNTELYNTDYRMALKALNKRKIKFDYVFVDPPHKWVEKFEVLNYIKKSKILNKWSLIIHQMHFSTDIQIEDYQIVSEKRHGKSKFIILKEIK